MSALFEPAADEAERLLDADLRERPERDEARPERPDLPEPGPPLPLTPFLPAPWRRRCSWRGERVTVGQDEILYVRGSAVVVVVRRAIMVMVRRGYSRRGLL